MSGVVGSRPASRELLDDLQAERALAGDDAAVVEGRDERQAIALCQLARARDPLFVGRPDEVDLGPVGPDGRDLHGRGLTGHDDDRADPEEPCRSRHALGVVAARVRDDARGALRGVELRDRVVRAADLERADGLEALGLEPRTVGDREQWRPYRDA